MSGHRTHARAALIALAALAIAACAKKDEYGADTTAAMDSAGAVNTMAPADTTAAASAPAGLTDANIAYVLDAANMSDSAWGAIAASKGTNASVRNFGKMMMADHHSLRVQGQALAKKLGVTPTPPSNDSSQAELQNVTNMLNGTAKGKDFDKAYIDHEVDVHKHVLDVATQAMNATQNAELKALIQKAAPIVQGHLDTAEKIQSGMK